MKTASSVGDTLNNTIVYSPIEVNPINPIVTIVGTNDVQTVDRLLSDCGDIIDSRYKPWFAKRFYHCDKDSILRAASIARQDGKDPQRYFSQMLKGASLDAQGTAIQ